MYVYHPARVAGGARGAQGKGESMKLRKHLLAGVTAAAAAVVLAVSPVAVPPVFAAESLEDTVQYLHSCPQCNGLPHGLVDANTPDGGYYSRNVAFLASDLFGDPSVGIADFAIEGDGACVGVEKVRLPDNDGVEQDAISATAIDAPGTVTITVTGTNGVEVTCKVTSEDLSNDDAAVAAAQHFQPVASIEIYTPYDGQNMMIGEDGGHGHSVGFTIFDANRNDYVAATWEDVTFASSNENVLRFTDDLGSFELVGVGTATITITCVDPLNGNTVKGSATINVLDPASPEDQIVNVSGTTANESASMTIWGAAQHITAFLEKTQGMNLKLDVQAKGAEQLGAPQQNAVTILNQTRNVLGTYDINLMNVFDMSTVPVVSDDGLILTVRIPLTEAMAAENPDNLVVYYLSPDGTMQVVDTFVENGCICFTTSHLSTYAVTSVKSQGQKPQEEQQTDQSKTEQKKDEGTLANTGDAALVMTGLAVAGSAVAFAGAAAARRRK